MTGIPDPNDRPADGHNVAADAPAAEDLTPPAQEDFLGALLRVLEHAERGGEAYPGAVSDHVTIRRAYYAGTAGEGPAAAGAP